ncbi:MAG: phenylalanine 4-monooxygenase, partial [Sphingopyxis sp.]
ADPVFADYMQAYGRGGQRSARFGALEKLARLYWYTVEFGLIRESGGLRVYGAGIISSHAETRFALHSASPHRIAFAMERIMRTPYRIDDFQPHYFVIDSFDQLLRATIDTDFAPLYARLAGLADWPLGAVVADDCVIHHGAQDYAGRLG